MRNIPDKVDGSTTLTAPEFNSDQAELENAVTHTGQSLDAAAGPDTDSNQMARAMTIVSQGGQAYSDGGAANTFVLTARRSFIQPTAYTDGMTVVFQAAATNTGACTINVGGLGAINFRRAGGAAHAAGEVGAGNFIVAQYQQASNRFEEVANTTPELSGPAAPDQIAIYSDAGSPTGVELTIEPGYIQPSAFTDQMAVFFKSNAANNGTATHQINIVGLGSRDVVEKDGSDPVANRFTVGDWVMAIFQEVRNEFEIAFVYDNPQPAVVLPVTVASSSGTVFNLQTLPETRAPASYIDGTVVIFRAPQSSTGSVDIQINSLGARDLRKTDGTNFASGEIQSGDMIFAQFVQGENRFRAFLGNEHPQNLRTGRSIRYELITGGSLSVGGSTLSWSNIAHDDLAFDNGGNPRIPAGQGIERVDIVATLNPILGTGNDVSFVLEQEGAAIAGGVVFQGAGSNFVSVVAMDVPVSDLDDFQIVADLDSGSQRNITGTFTLRVSKFSDP